MNYKPEESTLISYLYGELSTEEKKKVEDYLSGNEDALKELEEMQSTLSIMGQLKDKEVDVPVFTFDDASKVVVGGSAGNQWWKYPLGIAASISLIMVFGYLTSFNITSGENGLKVAFGAVDTPTEQTFTKTEVHQMISQALDENNRLVNQRLETAKDEIFTKVSTADQSPISVDEKLLDDYIIRLRQYNAETVAGLLEDSELEQRRYTDQMIQDFAAFMDLQRQNDMEVIQARIDNISDDAALFSRRTDQILTNLLSTDQTQNENQY